MDTILDITIGIEGWKHLPDFNIKEYCRIISEGLRDIEANWKETTAFIGEWKKTMAPTNTDPEATMQSYLRQEAEAFSLRAKIQVTKCLSECGVKPINLQHDGLVIACGKVPPNSMREILEKHSSLALSYTQPVEIKHMAKPTPLTASLDSIKPWPFHKAIRTPIFFDPYSSTDASLKWNAALAKEKRAIKYATLGITEIKHITHSNKLMDEKSFYNKYPSLKSVGAYKDIIDRIPPPALKGIKQGPDNSQIRWALWKNMKLINITKVHTNYNTEDVVGPIYDFDPISGIATQRIGKTGRMPSMEVTPCIIKDITPKEQKDDEEHKEPHKVRVLYKDLGKAPYDLTDLGIRRHDTLEISAPTNLKNLTVKETRKSIIEERWKIPRTLDKGGILNSALSTNQSSIANKKKEIRNIFKAINHPSLTCSLNENAYRVIHSGYWIGENKCNTKRGDSTLCQVCNQTETIKHMYCDCNKINTFWSKLLK